MTDYEREMLLRARSGAEITPEVEALHERTKHAWGKLEGNRLMPAELTVVVAVLADLMEARRIRKRRRRTKDEA